MTKPTKHAIWDTNQTALALPGAARELDGWLTPAGVSEIPPYQIFNYLMNLQYLWIQYLNEQGVSTWDVNVTYEIGSYVVGTDNKLYRALVLQVGNTPVGDATNWHPVGDLVNNLTSTDTTRALTAAQGKILKDLINASGLSTPATSDIKGSTYVPKRIICSNGTDANNDIDTTAGNFRFADGSGSAYIGAFTKELDSTWAAGTTNGGRAATVTVVVNNTYHYFALSNPDGSLVDFGFDTDINAANLLADANVIAHFGISIMYRRQCSIRTEESTTAIRGFTQHGIYFEWDDRELDAINSYVWSTTAQLLTLTIPSDIIVNANMNIQFATLHPSTVHEILLTSPNTNDSVPSIDNSTLRSVNADGKYLQTYIFTNTSGQIRTRADFSGTAHYFRLYVLGWQDVELDN